MADTLDIPIVDLAPLLAPGADLSGEEVQKQARLAAHALHTYGILCVRDPRADVEGAVTNDQFLDMLEAYFAQAEEAKDKDNRPEIWYQLGRTPSGVELPRDHCSRMLAFAEGDRPLSLCPPERDPKERFFWRPSGATRPASTAFPQLNAPAVVPGAFPQWAATMDGWGNTLLGAAFSVATLAALGFGLPPDAFTSKMAHGPHLLAPTASDFSRFGAPGTVLAGYHYDLNFLTAHGRSRFPGLAVWTRDGSKRWVKMPPGCLLVQAGKQFEHMTAGHVLAGYHEVVVSPATADAIAAARDGGRSLWRISSTLFSHIASDQSLAPVGRFADADAAAAAAADVGGASGAGAGAGGGGVAAAYPDVLAGDFVAAELAAINLGAGSKGSSAAAT